MTEFSQPPEPGTIRNCTTADLDDLRPGEPYMLRTSDDPASPWRWVKRRRRGMWTDEATGVRFHHMTVAFHDDDSERVLNFGDEIEVGFEKADWPDDLDLSPPEGWPPGDDDTKEV